MRACALRAEWGTARTRCAGGWAAQCCREPAGCVSVAFGSSFYILRNLMCFLACIFFGGQLSRLCRRWEEVQRSISACGKGRQPDQALELPADMQQVGLGPDMITRNAAISAGEKTKQPHTALELLAEMQQRGLEPTRRWSSLRTCCRLAWSQR